MSGEYAKDSGVATAAGINLFTYLKLALFSKPIYEATEKIDILLLALFDAGKGDNYLGHIHRGDSPIDAQPLFRMRMADGII